MMIDVLCAALIDSRPLADDIELVVVVVYDVYADETVDIVGDGGG